jgi:hypothetical protein
MFCPLKRVFFFNCAVAVPEVVFGIFVKFSELRLKLEMNDD